MNHAAHDQNLFSFKNDWAVVTGASSGIGRAYAERLAAAGMNLVLIARDSARLEKTAVQLMARHSVKTLSLPMDLEDQNEQLRMKGILYEKGIRIRFLCHAAGFGFWGPFLGGDATLYARLVGVHVTATLNLLLGFHDDLASHSTSVAVIVSSRAGYQPMPNMAVYAACKAFSQSLAQALFCEWEKEGIQVQSLMPGAVDTELEANQNLLREGILRKADMQNPNEVVEASIQGLINKSPRVFTGKGTWVQRICAALLPVTTLLRAIQKQFATKSPKPMISEVSSETNQVKRIQKGELYAHHVRK